MVDIDNLDEIQNAVENVDIENVVENDEIQNAVENDDIRTTWEIEIDNQRINPAIAIATFGDTQERVTNHLNVKNLTNVSSTYKNDMLKPYVAALAPAVSIESLKQWLPQVFQGKHLDDIQIAVAETEDVEKIKEIIISYIADEMMAQVRKNIIKQITPWDFAGIRDEFLTKLFGPASSTIHVEVIVEGASYTHELSQDLALGLLSVLNDNPKYIFKVNDVQLTLSDIAPRYDPQDHITCTYRAIIPTIGEIRFDKPDIIQGIITAAQWINIEPHTLVQDFVGNVNGKIVPMKF